MEHLSCKRRQALSSLFCFSRDLQHSNTKQIRTPGMEYIKFLLSRLSFSVKAPIESKALLCFSPGTQNQQEQKCHLLLAKYAIPFSPLLSVFLSAGGRHFWPCERSVSRPLFRGLVSFVFGPASLFSHHTCHHSQQELKSQRLLASFPSGILTHTLGPDHYRPAGGYSGTLSSSASLVSS